MQSFWRLLSIIVSVTGFLITGGMSLYRGEPLEVVVLKAVIAFAVLYAVQSTTGTILMAVCGDQAKSKSPSDSAPVDMNYPGDAVPEANNTN